MREENHKPFGEAEYIISADYRRHFEEMRDSSVATKSGRGFHCPTLMDILSALDSRHPDAQDKARPFYKACNY